MGVDNGDEVELVSPDGLLQNRQRPTTVSTSLTACTPEIGPMGSLDTHSGGFAGSIMTASRVFSSTTRYA